MSRLLCCLCARPADMGAALSHPQEGEACEAAGVAAAPPTMADVIRERKKKAAGSGLGTLRRRIALVRRPRDNRPDRGCEHARFIRAVVSSWRLAEVFLLCEELEAAAALRDLVTQAELAREPAGALHQDLARAHADRWWCDVELVGAGWSIPAHRAILSARCTYFRDLLQRYPPSCCRVPLEGACSALSREELEAVVLALYAGNIACSRNTLCHLCAKWDRGVNADGDLDIINVDNNATCRSCSCNRSRTDASTLRRLGALLGFTADALHRDMRYLLESAEAADARLVFRLDAGCGAAYGFRAAADLPCHRIVLAARSRFFRSVLCRRAGAGGGAAAWCVDEKVLPRRFARALLHAAYTDTVDLSLIGRNSTSPSSTNSTGSGNAWSGVSRGGSRPVTAAMLDDAFQLYEIARFVEMPIVVQGCEDAIVEALTPDSLPHVLRWAAQPHASHWVHRQAMRYLRDEFPTIMSGSSCGRIPTSALCEALASPFLQASEPQALRALLRWAAAARPDPPPRESGLVWARAQSVGRRGGRRRDAGDAALRDALAPLAPLLRLEHLPPDHELLQQSYTMQNDIPLQCQVLNLLNQLLTLRVNYCMLDSDQIFIGFLMKQLDLVEQHEIPDCCDLVNSILMFLVQLSSSKHHTKQIIEIPKLIQLCDGLMASGAHLECIAGLEPVAVKVFSNMGGTSVLGRAQQQEAQATREVLFYMLQKTMHQHKVLELVSCVLSLSQEHPESYYRWSELASDTLLNLLTQRSIELDCQRAIGSLERLLDTVYKDVLLEQSRVEILLKILFKAPPDQATTPLKLKLRYLSIIMVLLRKILVLIPESEILLTINYLKSTCISPLSIFFNVKTDVDPLNVQNVNENCANLSPDVILVRFLFKTLTYAIMEMDNCYECVETEQNQLLYAVCVNIIVQVKHMLHLTDGCLFPLTAKTAQNLLHNEQSGLNTGLYSPEENIPLDVLNVVCLKSAHRIPLLTVHWSHLLIRLNFLSHKYWQKLIGFARNLPLSADCGDTQLLRVDVLQIACVMAYCEYFVENGLTDAVHLTWLLVNRVHILVSQYREDIVQTLIGKVQQMPGASGLLLQAIAARCQGCLKDEFALNTFKILSLCHESQSGPLVFLICRIIGKLEPAIAARFAKLAIDRCRIVKELPVDKINVQLSKEDVQVALELLQRDKVHTRYSALVMELNTLASSVFDLSPLDLSQDRAINPQYIVTTNIDSNWLLNQVKGRCCQADCSTPKGLKQTELAYFLSNLPKEDLTTVMACPEFDRKILNPAFRIACDNYLREFLNILSVHETKEYEKESAREQREMKMREEMTSSIDSNKLNVVNTLHVFKKSDNKESKSQFFIPITDNENLKENFGNLQISEEDLEIDPPEMPALYIVGIATLEKSLSDIIRLFPKQIRPLSQSENFSLNVEQTIDRYTRRCHQVFQDKLFYQEFSILQTMMTGFLSALDRIISFIDDADCDLIDKCIENILPASLAKNMAIFSVISLQYLSFLIKNKKIVETPVHADVSFRVTASVPDNIVVDNVIRVTIDNVAQALSFKEIWSELNTDSNVNRTQSAISCLYAIVKYLVKDTRPLTPKNFMQPQDSGPKPDMIITGDKLITLLEYWENNFYSTSSGEFLEKCYREPIESLLVSLARLDIVSNIALIPPIAWSSVDVVSKKDQLQKIDLPLQALQDMDVLEAFLFRVNLIGWSSKKQFEEMWVGLLGALQGNGTHWAVRGITQLLLSAAPAALRGEALRHVPRHRRLCSDGMQRLRNILVGTSAYRIFDNVNLERIPLMNDGFDGYHYAQFNTEYLKLASDITDDASYKVKREVKRVRRNKEIDINSCLQILMDVTSQMLEPKAETGLAARVALLSCMSQTSAVFTQPAHWCWAAGQLIALTSAAHATLTQYSAAGRALLLALSDCMCVLDGFEGLQELSTVHQKLLKSLSSSYAPLRQAALQGCLLQLTGKAQHLVNVHGPNPYHELVSQLNVAVKQYLAPNTKISLYEQSLYWTVLFTLIELGHPELINLAVDFVLANPRHYCTDLVVKGITTTIRQQVLPKDLKNVVIEKLLENMKNYSEHHAIEILMVHLFSADNKLLSPKLTSDVSNMDPDILMNSMERITLLYKVLRQCKERESKRILTTSLKYFLRETLPPAATLSRIVIEFLECCKETEKIVLEIASDRDKWIDCAVMNAEIVFEVFQTSITQDQLPVLSGWIFEALCHLLNGKVTSNLLPYCLQTLLVSASSNQFIRHISPLCYHILRIGYLKSGEISENWGIFRDFLSNNVAMTFKDRRLLCVVSCKSNFTGSQIERLKELCSNNECLSEVALCLNL